MHFGFGGWGVNTDTYLPPHTSTKPTSYSNISPMLADICFNYLSYLLKYTGLKVVVIDKIERTASVFISSLLCTWPFLFRQCQQQWTLYRDLIWHLTTIWSNYSIMPYFLVISFIWTTIPFCIVRIFVFSSVTLSYTTCIPIFLHLDINSSNPT